MHYMMRQRLFSIGDDYWIENDRGERAYKVDGKALRLRKTLVIEDPEGNELAKIKERLARIKDTMEIEDADGTGCRLLGSRGEELRRHHWSPSLTDEEDLALRRGRRDDIERSRDLFTEQREVCSIRLVAPDVVAPVSAPVDLGMPTSKLPGQLDGAPRSEFRWLMESDVCKHCTHAACLDVCPTGSLFRTEFGTVVVQDDICNGCGYCVPACPFGVIDRRIGEVGVVKNAGIAQKCTLCYDRLGVGDSPACATACPTQSIQYGDVDELRVRAQARVDALHEQGVHDARLYGEDSHDGIGGLGAFFLLLDEPEVYGLPPDPIVTTKDLPEMWKKAALAAGLMLAGAVASFGRRL